VRQKSAYLAWLAVHFVLIVAVSCRDTLWLVAHRLTVLRAPASYSAKAERIAAAVLAQTLATSNPVRRSLLTYLHAGGIARGYSYFAPNVPGNYKIVFELHYSDGRVERELPAVNSKAAGLRLASLLDEMGRTPSPALREYTAKMLALALAREHPRVTLIRGIFGVGTLPGMEQFEQGVTESYKFLYSYDFRVQDDMVPREVP
jgi:hypothetical protein